MQVYGRKSRLLYPPQSVSGTPTPSAPRGGGGRSLDLGFGQHLRRASSSRRRQTPPADFFHAANPLFLPDEFSVPRHITFGPVKKKRNTSGLPLLQHCQNGPHPDWILTPDEEEHTRLTGMLPDPRMSPVLLKLKLKRLKLCALSVEGAHGVADGVAEMGEKVRRHVRW